jgi:hypothetical protein
MAGLGPAIHVFLVRLTAGRSRRLNDLAPVGVKRYLKQQP